MAHCLYRDAELHRVTTRKVTIRTVKDGRIKRDGRITFSRMADLSPYTVRSVEEQMAKDRAAARCLNTLVALRNGENYQSGSSKLRAARITMALRELSLPMFGVELGEDRNGDPVRAYVSASVLRDWARDGQRPPLFSMPSPYAKRYGMRGMRTTDIHNAVVASQAESRRNHHSVGMAQTAWRLARLEGDEWTLRAARHWLYHGNLKPCHNPACPDCAKRGRLSDASLTMLAYTLLYYVHEAEPHYQTRAPLPAHRMPSGAPDGFIGDTKQVDRKVYERAVADGTLQPRK